MTTDSIGLTTYLLMGFSLVSLYLETISNQNQRFDTQEKTHLRILSLSGIVFIIFYIILTVFQNEKIFKNPNLFIKEIATIFLLFNSLLAIYIGKKTLTSKQKSYPYFFILSSLTISIININYDSLIIKLFSGSGWLICMTALTIQTTVGGRKAEIALKLCVATILIFLLQLFAIYFLTYSYHPSDLGHLIIMESKNQQMATLGFWLFAFSALGLAGVAPFSFAHVDTADGGNLSPAFLLLANSAIQGACHLYDCKEIIERSSAFELRHFHIIGFLLAAGLLVAWFRALDQSKFRRTLVYAAVSISPVLQLSLLFGVSELLPRLIFIIACFLFSSISFFLLFGALAYMSPLEQHWQTWEDISGFGRKNSVQAIYLLVALASLSGLPGTLGYFIKLSLIAPMKDSFFFTSSIFISIAFGAICVMRIFVFLFSKHSINLKNIKANETPPYSLMLSSIILIIMGLFPFVR